MQTTIQQTAGGTQPIFALLVIDRLTVGPAQVEPRRVVCPYTIQQGHLVDTFEFVYRFEEDIFDPGDAAAANLAAVMTAQVALNYGLFCEEIVFRGPFDEQDQRFLREMAENTAKEIYVKKFLEHNPFLNEDVRNIAAVSQDRYCQARVVFEDAVRDAGSPSPRWSDGNDRIAVLSSGGKESLLSDSLLREMQLDVHAIFVNESGKHWFTALNGYRYFSANIPNTARVWTNCDRLFSWMLRRLPFIRHDFARVRADEYPIRLWTVAVFLFAALPLLRKRGIGRLVIGDEFDTTDRASFAVSQTESIAHHNGLYDQSRDFDRALSGYFHRKGWNVEQFSILRPLSEMLVEQVLVERYPAIQRLQTSCHAAHVERGGQTVRPCGRCEKCTRVVGMLLALDADPTACGYSHQQVDGCLKSLVEKGAMQESPGLEQMAFLLSKRGLLPGKTLGKASARERPELMKLRIHPDLSPVEDVPADLRERLYGILLQHADGAVRWSNGRWIDDPNSTVSIS